MGLSEGAKFRDEPSKKVKGWSIAARRENVDGSM
jgi:hypothetical protein